MAEPQDPAVSGVASTLTSLRKLTGLQEERLRGTEVPLDTLTSLDRVRELVAAGKSREQAIVDAVREAATALTATMRIIADASLCLRLYADRVPDADLYATDLEQRREAVLRNWDRLHQLESVSPGKPPSPRALRMKVESEALTALAVVLTASGSTRERPRVPVKVNESEVSEPLPDTDPAAAAAPTLRQTFKNVARALRRSLTSDATGKTGWRHDLRELPGGPTAVSTAYGIRAMLLLEDGLAADLIPVAKSLNEMAHPSGGYRSSGQTRPSAESTADVLNALRRIAATEDFGVHSDRMEKDLGDFEKSRPFVLTTMLETSLLFGPGSRLLQVLVDSLLAVRRPYGDRLLWPEKAESGLINPAPSVAHTARAVRVLADVQAVKPDGRVQEALEQAVAWLLGQSYWHNPYEVIKRPSDEIGVTTYHFTAAWVVKALVSAGVPATHLSVRNAISQVWDSYGGDTVSLWASDNGELPIWMTFDAIEALRLASLAVPAPSGSCRRREADVA
jgi:hypothetical protein